jgi:hypothetical protein
MYQLTILTSLHQSIRWSRGANQPWKTNVSSLIVRCTRVWAIGIPLLVLTAVLLWWSLHAQLGFMQTLEPDYLVSGVDSSARTMVLQKADHRYTVRCEEYCAWFTAGKSYRMQNVLNGLEFKTQGRSITLPIIEEDVNFPTEGGRG